MTNNLKNTLHLIIIFFFSSYLIQSEFILNFISKGSVLFGDHIETINWLKCNFLGFNLYLNNEEIGCGTTGKINYGYAFLSIPYNDLIDTFYRSYYPYIIIFLFIYLSIKIINPKNKLEILLLYLALLNPSSLLLLERLNFDSLIFIAAIFIVFNKIYIINWFLGIYFTLIKIYPIALLINILIENKNRSIKKILLIVLFLMIASFTYLYIYKEFYFFMLQNLNYSGAGYHILFSLNSIPKIFKYIFEINYQILLLIFYLLFIFICVKFYKKIKVYKDYFNKTVYTYNSKLFLIGGYLSVFIFIISSNYYYKEVFLILLIPFILNIKNDPQNKIFNFLIYIFIIKYFYSFFYSYININDGITYLDGNRIFSNKFIISIFIKSLLDFILMSIISAMLYLKTEIYLKNKFKI